MSVLPKAIVVDLDGTLATIHDRNPYDAANCASDLPNWPVIECVRAMHAAGCAVVFMSGRQESARVPSVKWIDRHLHVVGVGGYTIPYVLHMRSTGDMRPDNIVKVELFQRHVKDRYRMLFALDDRRKVVRAWREELGLTCFQVNPGPAEKNDCPHCKGTGTVDKAKPA